ncbi:hypothetical protein AB8B23_01330 [Leptotrichia sp. HSP-342]|uniref:Uncharacterized protein n=1 Tax=Leptotrichia mesophila TaxID=3239303 RepID=A0AB39VAV6_9FUSO
MKSNEYSYIKLCYLVKYVFIAIFVIRAFILSMFFGKAMNELMIMVGIYSVIIFFIEESRKKNLLINDKAIYPLLVLKNYKLLLTYKSIYATVDHLEEYNQTLKELENMKPDQFEKETVKTYNEITKLISKENIQDLKGYLIYPYSNVAHILQGDVKWTY